MTDTDLDWAAQRCLEVIRRAEDRTCPACAPIVDDPTGCTLCGGTRLTEPVVRAMFNVADVAALALAHAAGARRTALDDLSAEGHRLGLRY